MHNKGLTLIELIMTIGMLVAIVSVTGYVFNILLLSWSGEEKRAGISINIDRGIEEIVRDLREAKQVQSTNDEIRFTQDQVSYYIFYLYNPVDSYPPGFSQSSYQIKKEVLTGGINGTFAYGVGQLIMTDVVPPPTTDLSLSSNEITIDLSIKRSDETIRTKTKVKPRNL